MWMVEYINSIHILLLKLSYAYCWQLSSQAYICHIMYVCVFILDLLKTNVEILKKYR